MVYRIGHNVGIKTVNFIGTETYGYIDICKSR